MKKTKLEMNASVSPALQVILQMRSGFVQIILAEANKLQHLQKREAMKILRQIFWTIV